ncbi:ABC transporter substrate-binding protein [Actinoallomurus sp. NPDC052274]|uniref:ABC transporter substrate-binding protein n=1 Tax=Actinoallomurus sp. NPDC052274 TaxID=3155420 RepID=UPI003423BECE
MKITARWQRAVLPSAALMVLLGACGNGSATDGGSAKAADLGPMQGIPTPAKDAKLAALVPQAIQTKGEITVGTDATLAPKEFVAEDGKTIQGVDIDMVYAAAGVLGLKVRLQNLNFQSLIPAVTNGKFDLGNSSAAPTPEREKVLDFVTTDYSGESLLVRKEDAKTITGLGDLCGKTVAVVQGSLELTDAQDQNKKCTQAGKPAVTTQAFPDQSSANQSLGSGRTQVLFADYPVTAYQAEQSHGALVTVGPIIRAGLEAMFMKKGSGLAQPLVGAMNKLIADGTYAKILAKWGQQKSALTKSVVNPPTEKG